MLAFPKTRIERSVERAVAAGSVIHAEGLLVIGALTNGEFGIKPATADAKNVVGISVNSVTFQPTVPHIEEFVVPESTKVHLAFTPVGTPKAFKVEANGTLGAATVNMSGTEATVSGGPVAGDTVRVYYSFSPTMLQIQALQGNVLPGGPAGHYLGQCGVISAGDVYTDQWDTSADWSTAVGVKAGANGVFVPVTNAQDALPGLSIIELPTLGSPYLGLHVNLPN